MMYFVSTACVLSVLISTIFAAPLLPAGQLSASANIQAEGIGGGIGGASTSVTATTNTNGAQGLTNILSNIDIPGLLRGVNSFVKLVGAFCPPLSKVLDNVIQNVTSTAFRVFGRLILQNGGLGGGNSDSSGGGQKVNVVLPTFPPDEDYDDEEEDEATEENVDVRISNTSPSSTTSTSTEETVDANALGSQSNDAQNTTSILYTSPLNEENTISKRHVRVIREAEDQVGAESAPQPAEDLSNVETDDTDRNKRYLPFGGGDGHSGGSGNFLFDIIRNTADRAARTVGTVYRMVAGTENLSLDSPATAETIQEATSVAAAQPSIASSIASSVASSVASLAATVGAASSSPVQLVAGSGATEEQDEKQVAPGGVAEVDVSAGGKAADGYTEGIPGPITRLFVIANRGIANLVQDLILRLAQTSERLVNFKARLVTSLI